MTDNFKITTQDVGCTQAATIWLGDTPLISIRTQTGHEHRSIEAAQSILETSLRKILRETTEEQGYKEYFL